MFLDETYVINLDKDVSKMQKMDATLSALDMPYTRFPAIKGADLTEEEKREYVTDTCSKLCTNASVGCATSHKKLWETIARTPGVDNALILEDDCVFIDGCNDIIKKACSELPDNYDILYLGFLRTGYDAVDYKKRYSKHLLIPKYCHGTHAYIVSKQGAEKLCKIIPKVYFHVDQVMSWNFDKLNVYCCSPMVAFQNDMHLSNITAKAPILLNTILDFKVHDHELDGRTLSWYWSEAGFKLGTELCPVNFFTGIFILLGYFDYRVAFAVLGADYLYGSLVQRDMINPELYVYLVVAILIGVGLKAGIKA
jgi:GR25 family glycosyltransferase involved in LPS biosynthesis